jgi:hypothetical protein
MLHRISRNTAAAWNTFSFKITKETNTNSLMKNLVPGVNRDLDVWLSAEV